MKKRIIIITLCLVIALSSIPVTNAHEHQSEHDADLRNVLFGTGNIPCDKDKFQAIADAAALCIDQFSKYDTERAMEGTFNNLKNRIGFSYTFDDIDLRKGKAGAIKNPAGTTHRRYTHKGWNYDYDQGGEGTQFWEIRKKILIATVNKELFNKNPAFLLGEDKPCDQCEAFCELVYYVHILGDYEKGKKSSIVNYVTTPLYPHDGSPGLIHELETLIPVLFESQQWSYPRLIRKLKRIEKKAQKLYTKTGGIRTQEEADLCCEYAQEVLDLLIDYIPKMLQKTDFFSTAFPAKNAA